MTPNAALRLTSPAAPVPSLSFRTFGGSALCKADRGTLGTDVLQRVSPSTKAARQTSGTAGRTARMEDVRMRIARLIVVFGLAAAVAESRQMPDQNSRIPVATEWVLDAVGPVGRAAVQHVYLIVCPKTSMKGTGFLVDNGVVVTNEHVVRGCTAADIYALSSFGNRITFSAARADTARDLAALTPTQPLKGGLTLGTTKGLEVGVVVRTWGHPLGYNGPAPLLSVGYLSGFRAHQAEKNPTVKHLVVNAAFNSGNSGGPLFAKSDNEVVGVVVNKALSLFTPFVQSAIDAFAKNRSGVIFSGTGSDGKPMTMVESQVVAEVVASLRNMAQLMVGEAIAVEELGTFLSYKKVADP